jgi:hypothetical protein
MRMGRTGKVERMLLKARGIEVFANYDNFIPDVIAPEHVHVCCQVMKNLYRAYPTSYVRQDSSNRYSLHITSNLWYEFSVAGMK